MPRVSNILIAIAFGVAAAASALTWDRTTGGSGGGGVGNERIFYANEDQTRSIMVHAYATVNGAGYFIASQVNQYGSGIGNTGTRANPWTIFIKPSTTPAALLLFPRGSERSRWRPGGA